MAQKLRKGDTVQARAGKDRGKQGKVQRVSLKEGRALVEGVNLVKRHQKAQPGVRQGGIVSMEALIPLSRLEVVCPRCNQPVRVGFRFLEDGKKVRICRKCKETID
ncbi:MAG: 50S ribosomal protein L24 [Chloroflexi bacterium]|nr:50S ribosomal protein L24 [Chloroflexota bacterium]